MDKSILEKRIQDKAEERYRAELYSESGYAIVRR